MGVYRVELASSARATCKNTECQKNKVKIPKNDLRFCTQTTIGGNTSWAYKHWGCTTPTQIKNLKDSIEGNIDYLDGLDELPSEMKSKVLKALEEGHVDDSEWKGDLSQNRPGSTKFRSPAPKKKKQDDDEGEDGSGGESPTATSKKRGRGKKTEDMDHDATEPLSKKVKARSKKNKPQDDDQAVSETEEPHNTKAPGKGKKATTELASEASEEEPKPKRGRKKAIQKEPNIAERSLKETKETNTSKQAKPDEHGEKPKKSRGRPKTKAT